MNEDYRTDDDNTWNLPIFIPRHQWQTICNATHRVRTSDFWITGSSQDQAIC